MDIITQSMHFLAQESAQFERTLNTLHRKQTGSYYTSLELSMAMMAELMQALPKHKRESLYQLRFLEPCVGTGSFVFSYLFAAHGMSFSKEQYAILLNNIYVCDINTAALEQYKKLLAYVADRLFDIALGEDYFDTHIGSGLLFDTQNKFPQYVSVNDVFGLGSERSFDIVATNPPYKNLKAESGHYADSQEHKSDRARYSVISTLATQYLTHSISGVLNLYKLFVEEILERYVAKDGFVSLLIPSSVLTDKTCEKLRTRIIETAAITSTKTIPESSRFVDAQQALCALLLQKGQMGGKISMTTNFGEAKSDTIFADITDVLSTDGSSSILVLSAADYVQYKKMLTYPRIKELDFIINMRGELDLTTNKESITLTDTGYPLLRGRNIGYYETCGFPTGEYVRETFAQSSAKRCYIFGERIICQQISNMAKERRLVFAPIPANMVLGNSCNFIAVQENDYGIDLLFLLGVLNSSLMNWFFKLQSSNNHINNYEIDNFPIPIDCTQKSEIAELVREYLADTQKIELLSKIDALVHEAFLSESIQQLTPFEARVKRCTEEKRSRIVGGQVLNHTTFKLSDLDLEMVRSVPQGGSWKDIPQETVQKSRRLIRINETGGRTTLYGRIDYAKPSYTITTYFNRPGNGTYVHPIHDRVLSVREAARLQGFPDSYYFCGNKTQLLNQVGNAVPPLLAYQIGKRLTALAGCDTSLDLFCGAGGMTYGFKLAGIKSVLSNDIDEAACLTLKVNNPEIKVLCGDVTDAETKNALVAAATRAKVDIICGGPPCQGFSMAGFRLTDDPRNQLFKDFIEIVARVKPKVVVFENVEGILTFQGGKIYECIHELFSQIGYNTEGRVLATHLYAVPQRRKRVVIICTRTDLDCLPSELYPLEITSNEQSHVTARDAISDLENVECHEAAVYRPTLPSVFVRWAKGEISTEQYISAVSSKTQNAQLFALPTSGKRKPVLTDANQISLFDCVG